jgi:hypothetical protein
VSVCTALLWVQVGLTVLLQIIEGVASVVAAMVIFFLMPDYPSTSKRFLDEEESILACNRLAADGIAMAQGAGREPIPHWTAFKMTVSDWRVWAQCVLFILVTGSQTMQYFIPTLVRSFGWTGHVGQCKSSKSILNRDSALTLDCRSHHSTIHGCSSVRRRLLLACRQIQDQVALCLRSFGSRLHPIHRSDDFDQ